MLIEFQMEDETMVNDINTPNNTDRRIKPHNIRDHVDNGLVIFCGAGVSMVAPTYLPSWWEMNEKGRAGFVATG